MEANVHNDNYIEIIMHLLLNRYLILMDAQKLYRN